MNETFSLVT